MPDQFSSEYVDYILSDEAKALQEKWEPRIRDVFIIRDGGGAQFLVVGTLAPEHPFKHWLVDYVYLSPYGPDSGELVTADARISDRTVWLPTLHDLLRIIEGAGWEWSRNPGIWQAWRPTPVRGTADKWATIKNTEDLLSAAKLAVRALEVKWD